MGMLAIPAFSHQYQAIYEDTLWHLCEYQKSSFYLIKFNTLEAQTTGKQKTTAIALANKQLTLTLDGITNQ